MTNRPSRVHSEIDYDREGRQDGFLRLPHSVHRSAYGWIPIPVVQIKNGDGPTTLLMSGNHGDEFEGQVALTKLVQALQPEDITGRLIVLPMANYPAALAGTRTSPIDDGNLNRSFPGEPDGTPTKAIAHYIEGTIMPMCDYLLDMHAGGSSLLYPSTALYVRSDDAARNAKMEAMQIAFDAPYGFVFQGGESTGTSVSNAAAERQGALGIGTEMGGAGTVSPEVLAVAERGLLRFLHHVGNLPGYQPDPARGGRMMELLGPEYFVYARDEGLFEPYVELLDEVKAGQEAGALHHPEMPWTAPTICHFEHDGMVICKRIPGRAERGDCLFHLATDIA